MQRLTATVEGNLKIIWDCKKIVEDTFKVNCRR